jgi:hypothetical protein
MMHALVRVLPVKVLFSKYVVDYYLKMVWLSNSKIRKLELNY